MSGMSIFIIIAVAVVLFGVYLWMNPDVDYAIGEISSHKEKHWFTEALEQSKRYFAMLEEKYPKGTVIDFMGVDYIVIRHIGPGLNFNQGGIICAYTDKSGRPQEHFFTDGVLCIIEKCVKSRPIVPHETTKG